MVQSFSDQLGNIISLQHPPQRIVSLVPSQTELLFYLGLQKEVVGITKFCVHPSEWRQRKTIVGGTKKFHFDIIKKLNPDLIIGNKEENYRDGIEQLRGDFPVWMSDIITLEDAFSMIESVGALTDKNPEAVRCVEEIKTRFGRIKNYGDRSVLYLIWKDPWMAAGKQTFIDSILSAIGLKNVVQGNRYPVLSLEDIRTLSPQIIFLSTEPFPFARTHANELSEVSQAKVLLVDGEMFSWYGSRLIKAADYFNALEIN